VDHESHVKESMPHDTGLRSRAKAFRQIVEPLRALKGIMNVAQRAGPRFITRHKEAFL
jgi:hypothetical protein